MFNCEGATCTMWKICGEKSSCISLFFWKLSFWIHGEEFPFLLIASSRISLEIMLSVDSYRFLRYEARRFNEETNNWIFFQRISYFPCFSLQAITKNIANNQSNTLFFDTGHLHHRHHYYHHHHHHRHYHHKSWLAGLLLPWHWPATAITRFV